MQELPFRQIHLDFHTSEKIEGIGADFDPDEFADTLDRARVNSINMFARGHHGYIFYDTKAFPERRHPHLECNLLAQQIEACHKRGIKAPIYITVQWDQYTVNKHPEWQVVDPTGRPLGTALYEPGFYRRLCLNTPYVDFLKAFTKEVLETLPVDGLWFDIVHPVDCSCPWCRTEMLERGLDPSDAEVRKRLGVEVLQRFTSGMTKFVREINDDCMIFYNRGHVGPTIRPLLDDYTQLELESLPSGGWGYLHFPVSMRYARNLGKPCLGMNGKFHTSWGDFHSYKNKAALEFECYQMLALNGKCSVGDQLPPRGRLCSATYDLIGSVFSEVEAKEPWCRAAAPVTEIGVLTPEEFSAKAGGWTGIPDPILGATRMLQEGRHQFDVLDSQSDFAPYKVLILPDAIPADAALAAKIDAFVAGGGSLIASHRAGLDPAGTAFAVEALGVELIGEAPYSPDFIVPGEDVGAGLPAAEHVMYTRGLQVAPRNGAEVLADVTVPYFNRTWEHFCSHRHTPSSGEVGYPGIVRSGSAIYFAHPLFALYQTQAPLWCKKLLLNALDLLLPEPLVRITGPSTLVATVNEQAAEGRLVLHLLHYIPERRCTTIDVIEDVIPLHELPISVAVAGEVQAVTTAPEGAELPFTVENGRVQFVLPRLDGHQMIAISLA